MILFNALLLIITVTIIIYFVWNYRNSKSHPNRQRNDDIRYYELKSKYEFLVSVVTLFTIVFVFLGISSKKELEVQLKSNIESELKPSRDSILVIRAYLGTLKDSIDRQMIDYKNILSASFNQLEMLENRQKVIDKKSSASDTKVGSINNRINEISELNVLKREFYILKDITIQEGPYTETEQPGKISSFKFKDLITTKDEKLPKFDTPPFLLVSSRDGGALNITKVTTEGFDCVISGSSNWNGKEFNIFKFQIIVYN